MAPDVHQVRGLVTGEQNRIERPKQETVQVELAIRLPVWMHASDCPGDGLEVHQESKPQHIERRNRRVVPKIERSLGHQSLVCL